MPSLEPSSAQCATKGFILELTKKWYQAIKLDPPCKDLCPTKEVPCQITACTNQLFFLYTSESFKILESPSESESLSDKATFIDDNTSEDSTK